MEKLIGLYGGSFDPIHFGHLNLAIGIMEARGLNEVWFCPAAYSPFKPEKSPASDTDRLNMVKLAIEGEPRFRVTDIDINREGPSYTVDTLNLLIDKQKKEGKNTSFALILGSDAASGFHLWRKPEEIIRLARLLVGRREGAVLDPFKGNPEVVSALNSGMTSTKIMEISSTDVRQRLKNNQYCGHLVPGKVLDYIFANGLYFTPKK